MKDEEMIENLQRFSVLQRAVYITVLFYIMVLYFLGIQGKMPQTGIYVGVIFGLAMMDEILLFFKYFEKSFILSVWRYIQYIISVIFMYIVFDYPYWTIALLSLFILYVMEYLLAGDIRDLYSNTYRIIALFIPIAVFVLVMTARSKEYKWIYMLFSYLLLFGVLGKILLIVIDIIKKYEQELNVKKSIISDAEDTNNDLKTIQERIKSVNNELNYQKVELQQAYERLNIAKDEIAVQAKVAGEIASGFDMNKILNSTMTTMMESKSLSFCAIFIEKGTYYNKHANCIVMSANDGIKRRLMRDIPEIYEKFKNKESNTFIEHDVNRRTFPFVGEHFIKAMIIKQLIVEDSCCGLFIAGNARDEYDHDRIDFYEAIVAQLDNAIGNIKLYLQNQEMAQKDGLTGIYNRAYFTQLYNETIRGVIAEKSPISVALFDIDKFKRVNDTYGHLAGDEVIKTVAHIAEKFMEDNDGFVGRYGGEEFVCVLPGRDHKAAYPIIEELHKTIAGSVVDFGGDRIGMNVSIGLTEYPAICENPFDLLKRADWSMYYAKEHGRGQIKLDGDDVTAVT
ncbi:MAG: diguanylate cyclase [Lachnospiraceae bacterium]|nr:diguanylate cyclase [Lachnospiraceae bacterium]